MEFIPRFTVRLPREPRHKWYPPADLERFLREPDTYDGRGFCRGEHPCLNCDELRWMEAARQCGSE